MRAILGGEEMTALTLAAEPACLFSLPHHCGTQFGVAAVKLDSLA